MESSDQLIGEATAFLAVIEQVSKIAPLNKPVLIIGERGTGKELFAARLHFLSKRWDQTYQKLNCAAISDSLLETELFGHESGAFTGANKRHVGRFERSHAGSLFLDELATTSMRVQEKLLRVIEYGEFERVGGTSTIQTDVRLIAATNEDLPQLASNGKFRHDLLDRLAFDVITLPPLRHRKEDIPLLAEHFAIRMTKELERPYFAGFTKDCMESFLEYPWPGNIRELKNVVERNVYRHPEDEPINEVVFDPFESPFRPPHKNKPEATSPTADTSLLTMKASFPLDFKTQSQDFEISLIQQALEEAQFNQRKAADLLQVTYHQLRGYLKKYQLV
ncbi:MAG: phage shock protein operon transcriptional activator [Pseudomonadota bacterium]